MEAEARIARRLGWPVVIGGQAVAGLIGQGVDALVSFGLAGGLEPGLRPGAIIVPSEVIIDTERFPTDPRLSRLLGGLTHHVLLGGSSIIASCDDKRRCHERTGAAAVDLESAAVARAAAAHRIPFAVVRAICDPADRTLPPAALTALTAEGAIGIWRVLTSVVSRPGQLPALAGLALDAALARRSLIARVRRIVQARGQPLAGDAEPR
jgi:adenosylhomocysteine nucleosidase